MLAAMLAVLPKGVPVLAVGGVNIQNVREWWTTGAKGFGVGSALWKPTWTREDVQQSADIFVSAVEIAIGRQSARAEPVGESQRWLPLTLAVVLLGSLAVVSSALQFTVVGLRNKRG
jgi:hypothetical protein